MTMPRDPPEGFEPCSPCFNPNKGKIYGIKDPPPGPHWVVFVIDENGVERLGPTCKDGWGFLSCPNSPRNAEVKAMSKEEKDAWGASLFPLMDVARHFDTVFGVDENV
jgi:hypothetical protein